MKVICPVNNPWGYQIMQHLYDLNSGFVPETNGHKVDLVVNLLFATKNIRYGPKPTVEGQYRIKQIVKQAVSLNKPVPVLVPWGSIKADFSSGLDIAEVRALLTLSELDKRVRQYYPPGLDINIRIEDLSGVNLFQLEEGFSRFNSWQYCDSLEVLINMMGNLNAKRESNMPSKDDFGMRSTLNTQAILTYLKESKDLIKTNPIECVNLTSYKNLKANGWKGIISHEQRDHYFQCYRSLYQNQSEEFMYKRLALYFGGSLARFQLGMTGANSEWGSNYVQIVFVPPVKGAPEGYNDNYLYYRTIPMNQCRTHQAPWRAKGYFIIEEDSVTAKLSTFSNPPEGLQSGELIFEENGVSITVKTDFLV